MTGYNPDIHHRRSIRLRDYDYGQPGYYFITLCIRDKDFIFGDIRGGRMFLNIYGKIVRDFWYCISEHFDNVTAGEFIVMPNHMHGIIIIRYTGFFVDHGVAVRDDMVMNECGTSFPPAYTKQNPRRGAVTAPPVMDKSQPFYGQWGRRGAVTAPLRGDCNVNQQYMKPRYKITLGKIMAYYKYQTTRLINEKRNSPGKHVWQRNYYECIVKNKNDLIGITKYIQNNPSKWNFKNK